MLIDSAVLQARVGRWLNINTCCKSSYQLLVSRPARLHYRISWFTSTSRYFGYMCGRINACACAESPKTHKTCSTLCWREFPRRHQHLASSRLSFYCHNFRKCNWETTQTFILSARGSTGERVAKIELWRVVCINKSGASWTCFVN